MIPQDVQEVADEVPKVSGIEEVTQRRLKERSVRPGLSGFRIVWLWL